MKAIVPAAGLGTRLWPLTRVVPKELLPIGIKPAIHWVLEELISVGIHEVVVVIGLHKTMIREYLVGCSGLPSGSAMASSDRGTSLLKELRLHFVIQRRASGLGDALLLATESGEAGPWAIMLPDNVCLGDEPAIRRLIVAHDRTGGDIVGVQAPIRGANDSADLGVNLWGELVDEGIYRVTSIGQRGGLHQTRLVGVGRYVVSDRFMADLRRTRHQRGDEFDESSALESALGEGRLFGALVDRPTVHIGDATGYERAWAHYLGGREQLLLTG